MKTLSMELLFSKEVHLRPLVAIAKAASKFDSKIIAKIGNSECDAKSLLELIETVATETDRSLFRFTISGTDAEEAGAALKALELSVSELLQDKPSGS